MDKLLLPEQVIILEELAANPAKPALQRRAQVLLLYHAGQQTRDVAEAVGLSRGRTRYWRRAFQTQGLSIFPDFTQPLQSEAPPLPETTPDVAPPVTPPSTIEELREVYNPDRQHADHVRALARTLFHETESIHQLDPGRESLLGAAALLHDLGAQQAEPKNHLMAADWITAAALTDFSGLEQARLAAMVRFQRGAIKRRALAELSPLPSVRQETLTLVALLRLAIGLDASHSQTTHILAVEVSPHTLTLMVGGPHAAQDTRAAQKNAKLWTQVCHQNVRVVPHGREATGKERQPERLPYPMPQKSPGIEPWDPMPEAGRKILRYHFAEMLRHEDGTRLGEDIEELHDMRVATRRMRAAFDVFSDAFEPKAIKPHLKGLRATGRALGRVRDLDVFMEKAERYLQSIAADERPGLDPLLQAWATERTDDRQEMLAYLDSQAYERFKQAFNVFQHSPGAGVRTAPVESMAPNLVQYIAPILIYNRMAAVRAYDQVLSNASIDQLHALRIEFKKLRYTVEFFREVLGEKSKDVIDDIKQLQDHLGDLNDADVACQILREFIEKWEARQINIPIHERRNPEPIVAYLASKHAERHHLMVTFPEAWAHFNRPDFRHNLALALSVL